MNTALTNLTPIAAEDSTSRGSANPTGDDKAIERALAQLGAGGFDFEVVHRCPAECVFCDEALPNAA